MHRTLKYTYLKGKRVKRLDKGINAIMRLVRDKCIERLITIKQGKLSSKLSALRSRHKTSLTLDLNSVMPCDDGWNVASGKKTDLYLIRQVKDHCECHLICIECNTCLHRFICSCHDSSIKYNMCKHIHLLCKSLASRIKQVILQSNDTYLFLSCTHVPNLKNKMLKEANDENGNLVIVENSQDEFQHILTDLSSKSSTSTTLIMEKTKMKEALQELINKVDLMTSQSELDVVKKCIAPIAPTLASLNAANSIQHVSKIPHNKKIDKQRKFVSTKKKNYSKRNPYKKPTREETENIAAALLLN
ncbi:unnamed protein product [Ceutorhynchus assimilis]|uniref:SWIM-type domain-containing protein n=1 Tax=Ceutorhynchus assimilis TaxID=467358 RepID=A0A9N9QJK6_9CUCU|nr:unnamed protein product [Ceutorhynchus assimilis]